MRPFQNEQGFVLLGARGTLSDAELYTFRELLRSDMNWAYVLAQLRRHKLAPLFAAHVQASGAAESTPAALAGLQGHAMMRVASSRLLDVELCRLVPSFDTMNIRYAVLKGPILAHAVYENPSQRTYSDVDILVGSTDIDAIIPLLTAKGYVQGKRGPQNTTVIPADRRDLLWCRLYTHQLYPFRKYSGEALCTVDVQTRFFHQYGISSHLLGHVEVAAALDDSYNVTLSSIAAQSSIRTLGWHYFLLQLCLHAYVDEASLDGIVYNGAPFLRAYCDVQQLLVTRRSELDLLRFAELVAATRTNRAVCYVLTNLLELYRHLSLTVLAVVDKIRPDSLDFMDTFGHPWERKGEQAGRFSQPFLTRIFDESAAADYRQQQQLFYPINRAKLY